MPLPEWVLEGANAMSELMARNSWTSVGTMEMDPRTPGGDVLVWGRDRAGQLHVSVYFSPEGTSGPFKPITVEEWRERWPHSHPPEFHDDPQA